MAVDVDIDVGLLKAEIRKTYASVSQEPEKEFVFPTGRDWAVDLGYPEELLDSGVRGRIVRRGRQSVLAREARGGRARPGSRLGRRD
jgi:hypothetical protein